MQHDILADPKALCRVCMAPEMDHSANLYDLSPFGQLTLQEMLRTICAPVFAKSGPEDVMPDMPMQVCLACQTAIVAAYNLHQQCIETDRRLGELLALMWELQGGDQAMEETVLEETLPASVEHENVDPKQDCSPRENAADRTCSGCGKIYSTRSSLKRHKREGWCDMTHDPNQRTCEICNKVLKTVQLLKRHRQMHDIIDGTKQAKSTIATTRENVSDGDRPTEEVLQQVDMIKVEALDLMDENEEEVTDTFDMQCTDCGISFSSRRTHRKHTQEGNCQRTKTYPCRICGKIFDKRTRMQYHLNSHKKRLACTRCNETFKSKAGQLKHMKSKRCAGIKARTIPDVSQVELVTHTEHKQPEDQDQMHREQLSAVEPTNESLMVEIQTHEGGTAEITDAHDLKCSDCGVTFLSKRAHRKHKQEGNCQQTLTFPCRICGKIFDKRTRMQYHFYSHRRRLACPRCNETFKSKAGQLKHMKSKRCAGLMARTFQDVSQEELVTQNEYEQPEDQHQMHRQKLSVEERTNESLVVEMQIQKGGTAKITEAHDLQCSDCGVTFLSMTAHRKHTLEGICQRAKTYPCKKCGKVFDKISRMHYHLFSHRERVPCPTCDETFRYRGALVKHIKYKRCSGKKNEVQELERDTAEMTEEDDSQCFDCGVTFSSKRSHRNHTEEGNCQRTKTYPCRICGKVFDKRTRMQYHLYIHKERLACPRCNETFRYRAGLLKHMKRKRCSGKKASTFQDVSQGELEASIKRENSEELPEDQLQEFEEGANDSLVFEIQAMEGDTGEVTKPDFGVTFSARSTHTVHTQDGNWHQKPIFPCTICGKIFYKLSRMRYHRRNHQERVVCLKCDHSFKNRATLRLHIERKQCSGMMADTSQCVSYEDLGAFIKREYNEERDQMPERHRTQEGTNESLVVEMQVSEIQRPTTVPEVHDKRCTDCDATFSSNRALKVHTREGNCQQRPVFPCTICGKIFDKLSRMRYHRRNHKQRVVCSNCGQTYTNKACLRMHIKRTAGCRKLVSPLLDSDSEAWVGVVKVEEPEITDVEVKLEQFE